MSNILDPVHFVNVAKGGTFKKSGNLFSDPQQVDSIFAALLANDRKKITIHFHGGLVSEAAGKETAIMMTEVYKRANSHPVSFIWETGFFETIHNNLDSIHKTKLFKKILGYIIKAVGKQLGVSIDGRGIHDITDEEIVLELQKEKPFARIDGGARGGADIITEEKLNSEVGDLMASDIEEMVTVDMDTINALLKDEVQPACIQSEKLDTAEALNAGRGAFITIIPALIRIAFQVVKRYINGRDHGFYPTVLEEILREFYVADFGEWLWSDMKRVAEDMWAKNDGLSGEKLHGGTYFLEKLNEHMGDHPDVVVDLVGHSAGSIAICHMLNAISERYSNIKIRNIAFLAPACTVDLFVTEIVKKPNRYTGFRMFTMSDSFEMDDKLIDLPVLEYLYPRSLLYFISGVLEDEVDKPLAGMNRFMLNNFNSSTLTFSSNFLLLPGSGRLVLSVTDAGAVQGLRCASKDHGFFDNDFETQNSLVVFLN